MKYKCIRGVVTSGGPVAIGAVIELADYEAKVLMAQGKFIPYSEPEQVRVAAAPAFETREPVTTNRRGRKPRGN